MSGVNKVILVGNLGRDPEMRYTTDGTPVCNISVATSDTWKDKATGERREKTEWHRVVFFRGLAEICARYLRKGSKVFIEGKLQTRSYEKNGATHYITEIYGNEMVMLDSQNGPKNSQDGYGRQEMQQNSQNYGGGYQQKPSYPDQNYSKGYNQPSQDMAGYDNFQASPGDDDDDIPF